MVRGIVGHLLLVGDGRRDPAATVAVLAAADRSRAGNIAPPHGLVLEAVATRISPQVGRAVDVHHGAGQWTRLPGVARKTTTLATSSGVAARLRGLWARMASPPAPVQERGGHVGRHEPGRDRGHVDPVPAEGPRHGLPEAVQARLARPVGRDGSGSPRNAPA